VNAAANCFFIFILSRTALVPTHPPIQWVPGALFLGVKWLGCEPDNSPPFSAKVKGVALYLQSPNTPSWHGAQLKHRDNFTFIFYLGISFLLSVSLFHDSFSQSTSHFHVWLLVRPLFYIISVVIQICFLSHGSHNFSILEIKFHLCPNILLSTLFSDTCNLCSSHKVRQHVSQPYKQGENLFYICILMF
jgi:hypothetical protein